MHAFISLINANYGYYRITLFVAIIVITYLFFMKLIRSAKNSSMLREVLCYDLITLCLREKLNLNKFEFHHEY